METCWWGCAKIEELRSPGTAKRKRITKHQRDNKRQDLYSDPRFITENINGDICTSDCGNYTLQLVCNDVSETVQLLDQDG